MKVLVTGASGMLGSGLVPALAGVGHEVVATDIAGVGIRPWAHDVPPVEQLDVRDRLAIDAAMDAVTPDLVVHLAAETDLETCEADTDHAYATNAIGTKHVATAAARRGLPLVYISTAGVFDGRKEEPYDEFDTPAPINVYGHSKLLGEEYVRWLCPQSFIVRAGWMVGGGPKDHKFVAKIIRQLREGRTELHAVIDKRGTPTYVPDFSRCLTALIDSGSYGLYHMACEGEGTRYDVARLIIDVLGYRDRVSLEPVRSSFFQAEYPAPRPPSEIMRNRALDLQQANLMRPWRVALTEYLIEDFNQDRADSPYVVDLTVPGQRAGGGTPAKALEVSHP